MSPIRMERIESGVRLIIALTEAINRRDLPAMLPLLSEGCRFEAPSPAPGGAICSGKQAIAQYWQAYFQQYPQVHVKLEETLGYGLRCISRWSLEQTDTSGAITHRRGADIYRFQNGLIVEQLSYIKG